MSGQVIQLTRPQQMRPEPQRLGMYIHVGFSQHKEVLALLAEGIRDFYGIIVNASLVGSHKELIAEAHKLGLDVILDAQTQKSATIGGYTSSLGNLPWGLSRPHRVDDFGPVRSRVIARQIAEFAHAHGYTQILGPTHILQGPNDPWLRRDIESMGFQRSVLDEQKSTTSLIYPLALPILVLRDRLQREAIIAALADAPCDALWLKVENFGSDATGEKTTAYIEACSDFQRLGVPIVADQVGGVPGLGLLAFGATGGIAHGITMLEGFKPAPWRRERKKKQKGGMPIRVYVERLDLLLKPSEAAAFFRTSSRMHSQFGCHNTHCCPKGVSDMLQHPSRHFIYQRSRQIGELSQAPEGIVRIQTYLDNEVRRVSDDVATVANFSSLNSGLKKSLAKRQERLGRFRKAVGRLAEASPIVTPSLIPLSRQARENRTR